MIFFHNCAEKKRKGGKIKSSEKNRQEKGRNIIEECEENLGRDKIAMSAEMK